MKKARKQKGRICKFSKILIFMSIGFLKMFNVAAHAPRARARPNKPKYFKHIFLIGNFANCIKSLPPTPSIHISAIHIL